MSVTDIGKFIRTSIKNVHSEKKLTKQESTIASEISKFISKSQRNWLPVYVYQSDTYTYQVIGSPLLLEATKLAGLDKIYCIQIDNSEATKEQILEYQKILQPFTLEESLAVSHNSNTNVIDSNRNYELQKQCLYINQEDENSLKDKLIKIKFIGEKTVNKIIINRPFHSESDFEKKANINKSQMQELNQQYTLIFSTEQDKSNFN